MQVAAKGHLWWDLSWSLANQAGKQAA
jgi:hypothetical protein